MLLGENYKQWNFAKVRQFDILKNRVQEEISMKQGENLYQKRNTHNTFSSEMAVQADS